MSTLKDPGEQELYDEVMPVALDWLDTSIPDWFNRVDLATLNMMLPNQCVLGQVGGKGAASYLSLAGQILEETGNPDASLPFANWGDEWKREILTRRGRM